MSITLNQIARKAKLSVPSVSRALSGHPSMSAQTIERVQALSRQLGYQPPRGWKSRHASRPRRVTCVLVAERDGEHRDELMGSVAGRAAEAHNVRVELRVVRTGAPGGIVPQLREIARECDGLIITGHLRHAELAELERDATVPFVFLGNPHAEDAITQPAGIIVSSDFIEMGRVATRRLLDRGHKRIWFFSGPLVPGMWYDGWHKGYWIAHLECGLMPEPDLILANLLLEPGEQFSRYIDRVSGETPRAAVLPDESWGTNIFEFMRTRGTPIAPEDLTMGGRPHRVAGTPAARWPMIADDIDAISEIALSQLRLPLDGAPVRSARILVPHRTYNF